MALFRTKEYAEVLLDMTEGKTAEEGKLATKQFAEYLLKKGKLSKASGIMEEYQKLYNKKHNIVEATVTLISRLSEKTKTELLETLKKKYNASEVHLTEKVDQRLIGGIKIQVGDEVYDSSIQNSLKQLQAQLLK
jgi:F-type H+-transporting ATPase subunit delta